MQIITDGDLIMRVAQISGENRLVTEASIIGTRRLPESLFDFTKRCWASSYPSASFLMRCKKMKCLCCTIVALAEITRMNRLTTKALVKCHGWLAQALAHCFHNWLWRRTFMVIIWMIKVHMLTVREYHKILYAVIMTVPINMMYKLFCEQWSTKVFLHDMTMLKHGVTIDAYRNIARLPWSSILSGQQFRCASPSQSRVMFSAETATGNQIRTIVNRAYS